MKQILKNCILFFFLIFMMSCKESMSDADRNAAREGTRSQEIKKVNEAEVIALGMERGRLIADSAQKVLGTTLKSKIKNEGIESALEYCNLNAYPLIDSLAKVYSADIRRVSSKLRNPKNRPDSIELLLLEAYQYTLDQGQTTKENIQDNKNGQLLYTRPILIGEPVCLQCHGKVGENVLEETNRLIRDLYPEDDATGHSITEMRGMWSIRLEKKDIVNAL